MRPQPQRSSVPAGSSAAKDAASTYPSVPKNSSSRSAAGSSSRKWRVTPEKARSDAPASQEPRKSAGVGLKAAHLATPGTSAAQARERRPPRPSPQVTMRLASTPPERAGDAGHGQGVVHQLRQHEAVGPILPAGRDVLGPRAALKVADGVAGCQVARQVVPAAHAAVHVVEDQDKRVRALRLGEKHACAHPLPVGGREGELAVDGHRGVDAHLGKLVGPGRQGAPGAGGPVGRKALGGGVSAEVLLPGGANLRDRGHQKSTSPW